MAIDQIAINDTIEEWREKSNSTFLSIGDFTLADVDYWDTDLVTSLNAIYGEFDSHGHFKLYADPSTEEVLRLEEITPDEALVVDSSRNIASYGNEINIEGKAGTSGGSQMGVSAASGVPAFVSNHSGGTVGSESNTGNGSTFLSLIGKGWVTSEFLAGGQIDFISTESWTVSGRGSKISMKTIQNGSTTLVERILINSNGISVTGNVSATGDVSGATMSLTNTVNEFSIDGTLAGDSDSAIPTEKAVKTYMDAHAALTNNPHSVLHSQLADNGTYDHSAIDTHLNNAAKHRLINDSGTLTTELFSASKILSELLEKSNIVSANTTYYVSSSGSDSNDGLTIGNAFSSIEKALSVISSDYYLGGITSTVYIEGDGTDTFTIVSTINISNLKPEIIFRPYGTTDTIDVQSCDFMNISNSKISFYDFDITGDVGYDCFTLDRSDFYFGFAPSSGVRGSINSFNSQITASNYSDLYIYKANLQEYNTNAIYVKNSNLYYFGDRSSSNGYFDTEASSSAVGINAFSSTIEVDGITCDPVSAGTSGGAIGISLQQKSYGRMSDVRLHHCANTGLFIFSKSYGLLDNSSIGYSTNSGITLNINSTLYVDGDTYNTTSSTNGFEGLTINNGSYVYWRGQGTIDNNSSNGVSVYGGSYFFASTGTASNHLLITTNGDRGIYARFGSKVRLEYSDIYNNQGSQGGLVAQGDSAITMIGDGTGGSNGRVSTNQSTSTTALIYCINGSYIDIYNSTLQYLTPATGRLLYAYKGSSILTQICSVTFTTGANNFYAVYDSTITDESSTGMTTSSSPPRNTAGSNPVWDADGAYWANWGSRVNDN